MDKRRTKSMKNLLWIILISPLLLGVMFSCSKKEVTTNTKESSNTFTNQPSNPNYKIEFIELGSVNCVPCKKMQPILKSIENKYKGLVKVTFYDVWKDDAPAKKFGIRVIPTQVFLDANGKELMRHEGFFPEEEIDKFLQSQQVNIPQY